MQVFNENEIDGYTLLCLTEEEMENSLGIGIQSNRVLLKEAIRRLVVVWIHFGEGSDEFFNEQTDCIYFDE